MRPQNFKDAIQIFKLHDKLYHAGEGFISATNGGIHLTFEEFVRLFDSYNIGIHSINEEYTMWKLITDYNNVPVFAIADIDEMTSIKKTKTWIINNPTPK